MSKLIIAAVVATILVGYAWVSNADYAAEQQSSSHYCQMVAIWRDQAEQGVPKDQRDGWPPFKGAGVCK